MKLRLAGVSTTVSQKGEYLTAQVKRDNSDKMIECIVHDLFEPLAAVELERVNRAEKAAGRAGYGADAVKRIYAKTDYDANPLGISNSELEDALFTLFVTKRAAFAEFVKKIADELRKENQPAPSPEQAPAEGTK